MAFAVRPTQHVSDSGKQGLYAGNAEGNVAMQDRAVSRSSEWRQQIQAVDAATLQHLREAIAGGFDEERFGACIGFGNLKRSVQRPPVGKHICPDKHMQLANQYIRAAPQRLGRNLLPVASPGQKMQQRVCHRGRLVCMQIP